MNKALNFTLDILQVLIMVIFMPAFLLAYAGLFFLSLLDNFFKRENV